MFRNNDVTNSSQPVKPLQIWRPSKTQTVRIFLDKGRIYGTLDENGHAILITFDAIHGIPLEISQSQVALQNFLIDTWVRLGKCSDGSYFLTISPRLHGGWGKMQHKGYRLSHDAAGMTGKKVLWYSPKEGTYHWANEMGFSIGQSVIIGKADNAVDYGQDNPNTSVLTGTQAKILKAQSWHFNTNNIAGGHPQDSRIQHVVECLCNAINNFKIMAINNPGRNISMNDIPYDVLVLLGQGLHPLQDLYAHTDAFVTQYFVNRGGDIIYFFTHANTRGIGSDNPMYIDDKRSPQSAIATDKVNGLNQRYSDAKTATYIYFLIFLEASGLSTIINNYDQLEQHVFKRIQQSCHAHFQGFMDAFVARAPAIWGMQAYANANLLPPGNDILYFNLPDGLRQIGSIAAPIQFAKVLKDITKYLTHYHSQHMSSEEKALITLKEEEAFVSELRRMLEPPQQQIQLSF